MERTVLLFSGGIDSLVLLHRLTDQHADVTCLTVDYGQPAEEVEAAENLARRAGARWVAAALERSPGFSGWLLTFLGIAANLAHSQRATQLAHACRIEPKDFSLHYSGSLAIAGDLALYAPFVGRPKSLVVYEGAKLRLPMYDAWSCTKPSKGRHCGVCESCKGRREAFAIERLPDPTNYADSRETPAQLARTRVKFHAMVGERFDEDE